METPKFNYKDNVVVSLDCSDRAVPGMVIDSQFNRHFNRKNKTWSTSNVYLIRFGEDRACWYEEEQLTLQ